MVCTTQDTFGSRKKNPQVEIQKDESDSREKKTSSRSSKS